MHSEQRKNNLRLGFILASVALAFFLGFVAKLAFLGG
ncbi:cytochrome oxidase small assembly protein [Hydrogenophaga sp.]|nr:cytochrome oxidase small assembly protein [Hydrogenophaga sp.]